MMMEEYFRRLQNTVAQYIATRSLLDLCEGSEWEPGAWMGMWWWDQAGINLVGAREAAAAVVEKDGGEEWWRERKGRLPGQINSKEYT